MGNDVDQDQSGLSRVLGVGQHQRVEGDLSAESIEAFVGVEIVEIDREMKAFDLVDADRPAFVENHAVGAARDFNRPAINIEFHDGGDFTLEARLRGLEIALQPAVELRTDPEAGKAGPGETDRPRSRLAEQVADTGPDGLPFDVDD